MMTSGEMAVAVQRGSRLREFGLPLTSPKVTKWAHVDGGTT